MPARVLRPTSDAVVATWNSDTSDGILWDKLDEAVTQPTAPTTASDFIQATATGAARIHVDDYTLLPGETVTGVTLWAYGANSAGGNLQLQMYKGATTLGVNTNMTTTLGWQSVTYTGSLTQSELNDLRAYFNCTANTANPKRIYAAYIVLNTSLAYSDTVSGTAAVTGIRTEAASHTATPTGTAPVAGTRTEAMSHQAALAGNLPVSGTRTEAHAHVTAPAGTCSYTGTANSQHRYSDATAGTAAISLAATALHRYSDLPTGILPIAGTATGSHTHSSTVMGVVAVTGTAADEWSAGITYTDHPAGTCTIAGSLVTVRACTDQVDGLVAVTGSVDEHTAIPPGPPIVGHAAAGETGGAATGGGGWTATSGRGRASAGSRRSA